MRVKFCCCTFLVQHHHYRRHGILRITFHGSGGHRSLNSVDVYGISAPGRASLSRRAESKWRINTTSPARVKTTGQLRCSGRRKFVNPGNRAILQTTQNWTSQLTTAVTGAGGERRKKREPCIRRNFDESPIDAGETRSERDECVCARARARTCMCARDREGGLREGEIKRPSKSDPGTDIREDIS